MNSIQQIDWRLLRQQKEWLMNHSKSVEATGLLHLIDAIQDEAVDQFGFTEREVFGRVEEEN
jgi:hypothetical protein